MPKKDYSVHVGNDRWYATPEGRKDSKASDHYKTFEDRLYREGIAEDVENVATNAKVMRGKDASTMSNREVAKANREFDSQLRREANPQRGVDRGEIGPKWKDAFKGGE
jgi:hypothetical protein